MLKILKLILLLYFSFNFSYANEINTKVDQITKNLRCLICQGQSVYDSQSDFAVSMKLVVKNKIDEGKDCLLYTSPSPRDHQPSRMPSSA